MRAYSTGEVCQITGWDKVALHRWAGDGVVRSSLAPAAGPGSRRAWSVADLFALVVVGEVVEALAHHVGGHRRYSQARKAQLALAVTLLPESDDVADRALILLDGDARILAVPDVGDVLAHRAPCVAVVVALEACAARLRARMGAA